MKHSINSRSFFNDLQIELLIKSDAANEAGPSSDQCERKKSEQVSIDAVKTVTISLKEEENWFSMSRLCIVQSQRIVSIFTLETFSRFITACDLHTRAINISVIIASHSLSFTFSVFRDVRENRLGDVDERQTLLRKFWWIWWRFLEPGKRRNVLRAVNCVWNAQFFGNGMEWCF